MNKSRGIFSAWKEAKTNNKIINQLMKLIFSKLKRPVGEYVVFYFQKKKRKHNRFVNSFLFLFVYIAEHIETHGHFSDSFICYMLNITTVECTYTRFIISLSKEIMRMGFVYKTATRNTNFNKSLINNVCKVIE